MAKIVVIALASLLIASACPAAVWQIDTVDKSAAGKYASLKIDQSGNMHLAYVTEDYQHLLKYAFWDHALKRWFTMNVTPHASFCSLTLDSMQRPHISFADAGTNKGAKLRYSRWDGSSWKTQAIPLASDTIGYYTSIVLDKNDKPTISYYDYEGPGGIGFILRLRTVTFNGSFWQARTVDDEGGSGKFNSMAIDTASNLQLAYANVKAEHAGLRFAKWDGQAWKLEKLEGLTEPFTVYSVALALDKSDTPHIVYSDVHNGVIKYATRKDGKWSIQPVDSVNKVAYPDRNGIALDADGNPYLTYFDGGAGVLKLAHRKNSQWMVEIVDRNFAGFTSSVQIDNGTIWIVYADEFGGSLRCAHRSLAPADVDSLAEPALTGAARK